MTVAARNDSPSSDDTTITVDTIAPGGPVIAPLGPTNTVPQTLTGTAEVGVSKATWVDNAGAEGYQGVTMHPA